MGDKVSSAGKGDGARNNYSSKFRDNYASINWSEKDSKQGICDFCGEVSKLEVVSNRVVADMSGCLEGCKK